MINPGSKGQIGVNWEKRGQYVQRCQSEVARYIVLSRNWSIKNRNVERNKMMLMVKQKTGLGIH